MFRARKSNVLKFFTCLNEGTTADLQKLLDADVRYIDADYATVVGRENCMELVGRLREVDPGFSHQVLDLTEANGLFRATTFIRSSDAELSGRTLYEIGFRRRMIESVQSFRSYAGPGLACMLMPELIEARI